MWGRGFFWSGSSRRIERGGDRGRGGGGGAVVGKLHGVDFSMCRVLQRSGEGAQMVGGENNTVQ